MNGLRLLIYLMQYILIYSVAFLPTIHQDRVQYFHFKFSNVDRKFCRFLYILLFAITEYVQNALYSWMIMVLRSTFVSREFSVCFCPVNYYVG